MHSHPDHRRFASPPGRRSAFTMVELLVTVIVLAVLTSLIVGVLGTTGEKARVNSTKATIGLIDRVLQERYQKFLAEITEQERKGLRGSSWNNILGNAIEPIYGAMTQYSVDVETAKILVKQDRYRGWFPQRLGTPSNSPPSNSDLLGADDAITSQPLVTKPRLDWDSPLFTRLNSYAATKRNSQGAPASFPGSFNNTPETESAELLYFLVTEGADGISSTLENDVNPRHIGDTDDDGLPEFLDDWGHPLRFYNAPTSMYAPAGSAIADTAVTAALLPGFAPTDADPLDPADMIRGTQNQSLITSFAANYHAPGVNFVPIIVSMGPDESLGLFEPNDTSGPATRLGGVSDRDAAMDNITSRQTGAP